MYVKSNKFNIDNFVLPRVVKNEQKNEQKNYNSPIHILFPKYNYQINNYPNVLRIITDPIELKRGGLLNVGKLYGESDNECNKILLPLDEIYGGLGSIALLNILESIDKYMINNLQQYKQNYIMLEENGLETSLGELEYEPLVKLSNVPDNVGNLFDQWKRAKVHIPFILEDMNKKFNILLENKGEKKNITTIEELGQNLVYGCKAQFLLELKILWISKMKYGEKRQCGFKISCNMIKITETPLKLLYDNIFNKFEPAKKKDSTKDALKESIKELSKKITHKEMNELIDELVHKQINYSDSDSDSDSNSNNDSDNCINMKNDTIYNI
jgi:hypothetical protein